MFDIHHDDSLIHKESAKERQKQDSDDSLIHKESAKERQKQDSDDSLIHKESAEERQKQDNEAANALHSTQQKFGVFSSQANRTLQNIATKDLATSSIVKWGFCNSFITGRVISRF